MKNRCFPQKSCRAYRKKLKRSLLKCLEKLPENRYPDISALKKDLDNFLENKPLEEDSFLKNGSGKNKTRRRNIIDLSHADKSFEKYYAKNRRLKSFLLSLIGAIFILFIVFLTLYLVNKSNLRDYIDRSSIINVPYIESLSIEEAKKIVLADSLEIDINKTEFSENIETGHIISQYPDFNTEIKPGGTVFVTLSKGKEFTYLIVPNFIGFAKNSAIIALEEAGLKTGIIK